MIPPIRNGLSCRSMFHFFWYLVINCKNCYDMKLFINYVVMLTTYVYHSFPIINCTVYKPTFHKAILQKK